MNNFLNGLKAATNYIITENGAIANRSTLNDILDMFAFGAAYRNRSDEDCILLFKNAYEEDNILALRCLFYIRDIRGGQGERRFFRTCMNWLAQKEPNVVLRLFDHFAEYGRWDDFYCLVGTPCEYEMWNYLKNQFLLDLESETPSLLGKWLKSENTSSLKSKLLGKKTRKAFQLTPAMYRRGLSNLRKKINIVETLMSQNRWEEIEFDKIPSKAGIKYKNAFARRDIIAKKYEAFAKDENTKVNAGTLYPYEVVAQAKAHRYRFNSQSEETKTERAMINKYWDNLTDYFNGQSLSAICVVDTSGSMWGTPIEVAMSLGIYCAERNTGDFKDYYISFSEKPRFVKVEGIDFVDKVERIVDNEIIENTNIEAVFDLLLNIVKNNPKAIKDMPKNIIIISDMEFDRARYGYEDTDTLFENIKKKWDAEGIKMPHLIFWNVDARQNNIPIINENQPISYVSGFSPSIFETIISGKSGVALMMEVLNSERYAQIN